MRRSHRVSGVDVRDELGRNGSAFVIVCRSGRPHPSIRWSRGTSFRSFATATAEVKALLQTLEVESRAHIQPSSLCRGSTT
jgi:hypothetical protein